MKNYRVVWTPQAKRDLRDIKRYISRDAPSTARAFIRRIQERVRRVGCMPSATAMVLEVSRADIREIYVGSYRIIFRVLDQEVHILLVTHGSQLLKEDRLRDDEP
jgi:toxin ParE1/3/4